MTRIETYRAFVGQLLEQAREALAARLAVRQALLPVLDRPRHRGEDLFEGR